ncbi:MAG: hypothetical protein ACE5JF_02075 [Anaerolineales bacterium]
MKYLVPTRGLLGFRYHFTTAAKDPSERFSTAGKFAKALEAAIAKETVDALAQA